MLFTIFKYLFLFWRYSSFFNMLITKRAKLLNADWSMKRGFFFFLRRGQNYSLTIGRAPKILAPDWLNVRLLYLVGFFCLSKTTSSSSKFVF